MTASSRPTFHVHCRATVQLNHGTYRAWGSAMWIAKTGGAVTGWLPSDGHCDSSGR